MNKENKEDEIELEFVNKINEKWKTFSTKKKSLVIGLLGIIFISIFVILMFASTRIETLHYPDGCKEVYINGKLNGSECTESKIMIEQRQANRHNISYTMPDINFSDITFE